MWSSQRQPGMRPKLWHAGIRTRMSNPPRRAPGRRMRPSVTPLEDRTLLTTPTLTTLVATAASLTYGQTEILTATVTTNPPSETTPTGGSVTFLDGSTTLGSSPMTAGSAAFDTTSLGPGIHVVTAVYSGDAPDFFGSSTLSNYPTIATVAGGGSGTVGDGGPATSVALNDPSGVAVDTAGDIFIADSQDQVICEVNHATGLISIVAGDGTLGSSGDGGPATAGELDVPGGLAVDAAGDIFIADSSNNEIREVNHATGSITTVAGDGTQGYTGDGAAATGAALNDPNGIAVNAVGDLFIADSGNSVIREVDHATGSITTVAGDGTQGYTGDGAAAIGAELAFPKGVAVDAAGDIFIADSTNNVIREVNHATGSITTVAGDGTYGNSGDGDAATTAALNNPTGVAVDAAGDIFIADQFNNEVREVDHATGVIFTVAGDGTSGDTGDGGPATAAELNDPSGVAVGATGNLFVADSGNNAIREASPGALRLSVVRAQLTVTANSLSQTYGAAVPALTYTITGFVNGDSSASLTTPPSLFTPATSSSPIGSYPIVVAGASSPDYAITFVDGTLTVTPEPVSVQSTSIQKVRVSKKKTTQVIVLQFSGELNAADAETLGNYRLVTVAQGKKHPSKVVALSQASYNASTDSVTLSSRKPLVLNPSLQLTLEAAGLLDTIGRPLDGDNSGQPGSNFVATLSKRGVTVISAVARARARHLFAHAERFLHPARGKG